MIKATHVKFMSVLIYLTKLPLLCQSIPLRIVLRNAILREYFVFLRNGMDLLTLYRQDISETGDACALKWFHLPWPILIIMSTLTPTVAFILFICHYPIKNFVQVTLCMGSDLIKGLLPPTSLTFHETVPTIACMELYTRVRYEQLSR